MKVIKPIYGLDKNYYNFNYYFYLHSKKYSKVLDELNIFHYQKNNYFVSRNYMDLEEELYLDYNNINYYDLDQNLFNGIN